MIFDADNQSFLNDQNQEKIISVSWRKLAMDLGREKGDKMLGLVSGFMTNLLRSQKHDFQGPSKFNEF